MNAADKGAMAAVLGLERDALQAVLDQVDDIVVIANDNCPGQLVISGSPTGVSRAGELALVNEQSGCFHSMSAERFIAH